ncbi:sel1 repeat family protein [Aggregatibacter actinomycetemcomitans]|nr:sel1 repeat family protein [Aggregatibacter actinomycetemcomitans]
MTVLEQLEEDFKTCPIEQRPPLSEETQQLYNYAHYHDLHNMWNGKKGDQVWQDTLPYYRIAAANGDYKANVRLQYLLSSGRIAVGNPWVEIDRLNKQLEKQLPAVAHYKMYFYLKNDKGFTVNENEELVFLRKAAELGNKEAQYELGEIIIDLEDDRSFLMRRELRKILLNCSAIQGHPLAAEMLGVFFQLREKKYDMATELFHLGVKNGNPLSASRLEKAFHDKIPETNKIDFLDLPVDRERAIRYKMIGEYLFQKDYLNPKVPDLDEIVPLPPAPLPAWDGKIAFQRWYEGPSPAKPSDELMQKLADKAGLDVKTGLPLQKKATPGSTDES